MSFAYRREYRGPVGLVAFDWAGTIVDFGCRAPAMAFVELFASEEIAVTVEQARGPMGIGKREHIQALLAMPAITAAWQERHGAPATAADVDRLYEAFAPIQVQAALDHARLIPGALEVQEWLRARDVAIATNSGYFQAVMDALVPAARAQGFEADSNVCATDVPEARPAPWMLVVNMLETGVYPAAAVVKVGDTVPDVEEALNAGAWAVAVIDSGNELGLGEEELAQMPRGELGARIDAARDRLARAGAHFTIPSVADLPAVIEQIDERLARGARP